MDTDSTLADRRQSGRAAPDADAFAERLFHSTLGLIDMMSVYVGDRLGWYRALADAGTRGVSVAELAVAAGTVERYTREWLEQQAVAGILECSGDETRSSRRFSLPDGAREVLANADSLTYMAPVARMFGASMANLPAMLRAYRAGGGVSWDELGDEAREAQADVNRPWFEQRLAPALAEVPELDGVLSGPGARIADIGCGFGWSTLALARAYPGARFVGIDIDQPSVARAEAQAAVEGLSERIEFRAGDASALGGTGVHESGEDVHFDAAFIFEALHDMPHPVPVLRAVRSALAADGVLVVMDEAVADELRPDGDDVERLMYGYSLFVCLPDSLSAPQSVGTGTVMRRSTLERYAHQAGFESVEVLPIENFAAFRFYLLRP